MNSEELKNTIEELTKIIGVLGDINMFCDSKSKTLYQKKLHKTVDDLFKLKKHLEFIKTKEKRDENSKRKVQELLGL